MTLDELIARLPLLTGLFFAVGLLLVFFASQAFRRSRRAPYWTQRRQAGQRGFRTLLFALFFLTISAIFCGMTLVYTYIEGDTTTATPDQTQQVFATSTVAITPATATPEITAESTPDVSPTLTDTPTLATATTSTLDASVTSAATEATSASPDADESTTPEPAATDNPTPTDEPTTEEAVPPTASPTEASTATPSPEPSIEPSVTPTLEPTATEAALPVDGPRAVVVASRTPAPDAVLSIDGVASQISDRLRPLNQGRNFDAGFVRLYLFVEFEQMANGVVWRRELLQDGQVVYARDAWWGNQTEGSSMFFISLPSGFGAGEYVLNIYLADTLVDSATFSVD